MEDRSSGYLGFKRQEADVVALTERIMAIVEWLEHTDNLLEIFAGDEKLSKELRMVSSAVRMRRNDLADKSATLQAELKNRNGNQN